MRCTRVASTALLAGCLLLPHGPDVFAGDAEKTSLKSRQKGHQTMAPLSATSVPRTINPPKLDTVTEYRNELGQTVYSIAASKFDISRPLREMAATVVNAQTSTEKATPAIKADEEPTASELPGGRVVHSSVRDPVVQVAVQPGDPLVSSSIPPAAPTTGFNFTGIDQSVAFADRSDSNGSVGNNQFVEVVNFRYQVWSLDRATKVATSVLGPSNVNTLWAGFGGECEAVNSGDPIVLFDKTAKRWLISQPTFATTTGVYYQCVAVSTTADATGSYARYAFAVPGGKVNDYAKFGAWRDAYYMSASRHTNFGAGDDTVDWVFGAMDRTKMLQGGPATWIVILNAGLWHLPADLDGFALPPSNAPGVFVAPVQEGMNILRMKVSFSSPASSSVSLQASVPVAPHTAPCLDDSPCIPQPGTEQTLGSHGLLLMFRAAYRNFIDHESLVVSKDVDPSVSGVKSGVRWYDFRLSGNPDATCPTYPCLYQQGTIADVPDGRSRHHPSIAMDTAENILVGYSTSGKTDGSENHSSRYTGRAKADPPGLMTAPETTIVNGTANNVQSHGWGDYASMSVDPVDDCTFWYVSQYYQVTNHWSTRIASAAFPPGGGAGQCPPTTCDTRPNSQPTGLLATTPGDNQITVSWTGIAPTPGAYAIERADGTCGTSGLYRPLTAVIGTASSFTDSSVQGGLTYSYRVRSAADAAGKCQANLPNVFCVNATATGNCTLKPTFQGVSAVTSHQNNNCGLTVSWTAATSKCPLTPSVRYNIYRGSVADFVPSPANRIATCVVGSSYLDTDNLASGTSYYYIVRAEDASGGNGGGCAGGNEDSNSVAMSGTPYAAGTQASPGTWVDGGGDGTGSLRLNVAGFGDKKSAWRIVTTASDPGANHTPGGAYAYRNAGPAADDVYVFDTCAEVQASALTVAATSVNLTYWERHQLGSRTDAVALEYSVNGGAWNDVPDPSNSVAEGCATSDDTNDWVPMDCQGAALSGCRYPSTKLAFSGPLEGEGNCQDVSTGAVTAYVRRCHFITGLSPDDTIQFRWRFSSDAGFYYQATEYTGFYLDDIAVTNVRLPNACVPDTCAGQPDATACDDGNACTAGDLCSGGACTSGAPMAPPEAQHLHAAADKTTYAWDPVPNNPHYDVVRGALASLPFGPGGGDELCFDDLATAVVLDPTTPAPDTGFWYVSRAVNACGVGPYGTQSNGTPRVSTTCP